MHPARCAVCKCIMRKQGKLLIRWRFRPSSLHYINVILPVICTRTCLKSWSTHPPSLPGPFCALPLHVACGEGRSCDVRVCVCLGGRGLLVTQVLASISQALRERESRLEAVRWWCKANRCTSEQREPQQKIDQNFCIYIRISTGFLNRALHNTTQSYNRLRAYYKLKRWWFVQ